MVWVGRDLKDHLVPIPLPWAGTSSTRPGCSQLHPAWPWTEESSYWGIKTRRRKKGSKTRTEGRHKNRVCMPLQQHSSIAIWKTSFTALGKLNPTVMNWLELV